MSIKPALLTCTALLCTALFGSCKRRVDSEPHLQNGADWMSWSPAERNAFVMDFESGYTYGALETCGGIDHLWQRDDKPSNPEMYELPGDNLRAKCKSRIDGFTKFKVLPDNSTDFSSYSESITDYFENHPEKRSQALDSVILGMRDSTFDQAVQDYTRKK